MGICCRVGERWARGRSEGDLQRGEGRVGGANQDSGAPAPIRDEPAPEAPLRG